MYRHYIFASTILEYLDNFFADVRFMQIVLHIFCYVIQKMSYGCIKCLLQDFDVGFYMSNQNYAVSFCMVLKVHKLIRHL